ncbi:MAG: hypothetical protein JXA96_02785 [Sedimentisphaerales bacterium]|nr:hypothetical protein [Sedimentisphaerales bacterium]
MNQQQEKEIGIIKNFFKTLKLSIKQIKPGDKPDVIVKMFDNSLIGIEVREYFVDENPNKNGSPGQNLFGFWTKVQENIESLRTEYSELSNICTYIKLKKDELKKVATNPIVKILASEIVSFVKNNSENAVSDTIIIPEWKERIFRVFPNYPHMNKYVSQIDIYKTCLCNPTKWNANVNASFIGINYVQLAKIIKEKNYKAQYYKLDGIDELWLLIASPHDNIFNAMHPFPDQIDFSNSNIQESCKCSKFDKIYFWSSSPHEWYKLIWPYK